MSDPRTQPDETGTLVADETGPESPETDLVEEVSIDGMCGVY